MGDDRDVAPAGCEHRLRRASAIASSFDSCAFGRGGLERVLAQGISTRGDPDLVFIFENLQAHDASASQHLD